MVHVYSSALCFSLCFLITSVLVAEVGSGIYHSFNRLVRTVKSDLKRLIERANQAKLNYSN